MHFMTRTTLGFLMSGAVGLAFSQQANSGWTYLVTGDDANWSILESKITRPQHMPYMLNVWVERATNKPEKLPASAGGRSYIYSRALWSINCSAETFAILTQGFYDPKGINVHSSMQSTPILQIFPETVASNIAEYVCTYSKPAQQAR